MTRPAAGPGARPPRDLSRPTVPRLGDVVPSLNEMVPWTDRRGRFHPLRSTVLLLLLLPLLWLGLRWALGRLGPEPVNAAIHATGYYAIWILLASLVISPAKALAGTPNIVVVRRMLGNGALLYALLHLVLYAMDQHWRMAVIVTEIVTRFYLTIGFVALLGLLVLGFTSTDGWARHLGRTWKRVHRVVYALTALGLFHYVLQSKLDVSSALLAMGVFAWLMLWRLLPAGRDRSWAALLAITLGAGAVTLACEYAWYRFGTRIDPNRVLLAELDVAFGPHPCVQVLLLGLVATVAVQLHRAAGTMPRMAAAGSYALGGLASVTLHWFFALEPGLVAADEALPVMRAACCVAVLAVLGLVRSRLAEAWQRHLVDGIWAACLLYEVVRLTTDDPRVVTVGAGLLVAGALLLALRLRSASRGAVLVLVPLAALLAYQAALV